MRYFDRGGVFFTDCEIVDVNESSKTVAIPDIGREPVTVPRTAIHIDNAIYHVGERGWFVMKRRFAAEMGYLKTPDRANRRR